MKLTQAEAMELLKSIGVDAELVEEQEASEFDMNDVLSSIDNNRRGILKPIIEDELRDEITGHIAGKVGGTLERALVSLTGVNIKDIQGIADKEKIEKAITHYKTTLSKEQEEIASQIDEISSANQAAIDALKEEYEQKLQVANQRYIDRDINDFLYTKLKEAPFPEGADRGYLSKDFKKHLESKYNIKYSEKDGIAELYSKDKPDFPAMNASKNARVDFLDEAKEYFTPRGLWQTDMRGVNPSDKMKGVEGNIQQPKDKVRTGNNLHSKRQAFQEQMQKALAEA